VHARPCYAITWIDGGLCVRGELDQITRLFARRITRIDPSGQRTVETARLRAPR
jgi:hypothetical protein